MAISQTRMINLIKIADAFKSQLLLIDKLLSQTFSDLPPDPTKPQLLQAIQTIQQIKNSITLSSDHLEILSDERAHFKLHASRNSRLATKARLRRGQGASAVSTTAPPAIGKSGQFFPKPFQHLTNTLNPPDQKAAKLNGAAKPYQQIRPLSDAELSQHLDLSLAMKKLEINKTHADYNMPLPYPDPYDDAQPLLPEHGGNPSSDDELF